MPLFDYQCGNCNHTHESIRSADCETLPCPLCGSTSRKLLSAPAFICINGYSEKNGYGTRLTEVPAQYEDVANGKRPHDEHGN